MNAQQVDFFLITNQKNFPAEKLVLLRQKLLAADEGKFILVSSANFKDPTAILLVSVFLGWLGIDRFMLGDVGIGMLKLLTGGVCGILMLIDWFKVFEKAKEVNFNNLMAFL